MPNGFEKTVVRTARGRGFQMGVTRSQLPAIQKVRNEYLSADSSPVSTSVMVAGLGSEEFLVELTSIAVIPNSF